MNFWRRTRLKGAFDGLEATRLRGWVGVPEGSPPAYVQVHVNGIPRVRALANVFREDLLAAGIANGGRAAFEIPILLSTLDRRNGACIELIVEGAIHRLLGVLHLPSGELVQARLSPLPMRRNLQLHWLRRQLTEREVIAVHKGSARVAPPNAALLDETTPALSTLPVSAPRSRRMHTPFAQQLAPRAELSEHARRSDSEEKLSFRIVGHIDGHYSLSAINRGLAIALDTGPGSVTINHYHGARIAELPQQIDGATAQRIIEMIQPWDEYPEHDSDRISITHHYPLTTDGRQARLRLAVFFWEESIVPRSHITHLNENFDAIVVATQFVRKVLRDSGCIRPIRVVPIGVDVSDSTDEVVRLPERNLDRLRFLHVSSAFPRKGIDVLLQAYFEEFTRSDPVELVIKTFPNVHNTTNDLVAKLREEHRDAPLVSVDERILSEREMHALYRSCDVVVLPTRGEGFNLPAAEAMAIGKPVIVTGYGGQWDFLTGHTGWCLDFDFAPSQTHLASTDSLWLEPNRNHLRTIMREFMALQNRQAGDCTVAGKNVESTIRAARKLITSVYNWSNTKRSLINYCNKLTNIYPNAIHLLRVAWISSWNCRCGIAEYSNLLTSHFDPSAFQFTYICDVRSAACENVLPLWTAHPDESLSTSLSFVSSQGFDIVAVQYQPSLFNLDLALCHLEQIQSRTPVFLFMHSTRHMVEVPPSEESTRRLRRLERIFVHTLDDLAILAGFDVVENVTLLRHGVIAPIKGAASPPLRRRGIERALLEIDQPMLASSDRQRIAVRMQTGAFWLASFGFLLPHKGITELIKAVRLLHDAGHGGVRLLLLCATLDERSQQQVAEINSTIERLGLADSITLVGDFLNVPEITTLLSAADLIVYPYQRTLESASGAIRIGLGSGRPILTTRQSIFQEVADFAFQSRDGTPEALAEAIAPLVIDRSLLESRKAVQDEWVAERSWDRIAERLSTTFLGTAADRRLEADQSSKWQRDSRAVSALDTSNDIDPPICPPGIIYPRTGRTRPWLAKCFRLRFAHSIKRAECDVLVSWRSTDLTLALTNDSGTGASIHLSTFTRFGLSESTLVIEGSDLQLIPERERPALFQYARRHQIRTIVRLDRDCSDLSVILADVILRTPDACSGLWNLRSTDNTATHNASVPQISQYEGPEITLPEVATLRRLDVVGAELDSSSRLLAALRSIAETAVNASGEKVITFHSRDNVAFGWRLLCGGCFGASCMPKPSGGAQRSALLVDAAMADTVLRSDELIRRLASFELVIFEDRQLYRHFFAAISRRSVPVARIRQKSALLSFEAGDELALIDRFARLLRLTHPLRLTDLGRLSTSLGVSPIERSHTKLSICVSTYNRANWLKVTLPLLLAEAVRHRNEIEFVIVDNASTDNTQEIVSTITRDFEWIRYERNAANVGMLGNLAVTARFAKGDFVWILGDDDLVKPGTVSMILDALRLNPKIELLYLNYAYTHFDQPSDLRDVDALMASATDIAPETPSGFYKEIRRFAARNENLFTAIYACVFRRDHALAAYCQFTDWPPFSDLASCIPTTKYVLENMLDRPGYWIGEPRIVVNMNVSWLRYAPVWHLERLPEVYDLAEEMGVSSEELTSFRKSNVVQAVHFTPIGFCGAQGVSNLLSMCRYFERARGVDGFEACVDELLARYEKARRSVDQFGDATPAGAIRATYGI